VVGGQSHASATLPAGKTLDANCIGGRVVVGPVWTGAENLALTGPSSP